MANVLETPASLWIVQLYSFPDVVASKDQYDLRLRFAAQEAEIDLPSMELWGEPMHLGTYRIEKEMLLAHRPIIHTALDTNDFFTYGLGYTGKSSPGSLVTTLVSNVQMRLQTLQEQKKPLSFDFAYLASNFPQEVVEDPHFFDRISHFLDGLEGLLRHHGNP